ncbi:hypothetical protein IT568_10130 [bacterium]|nr:hypothetical protein [bacterium]
MKYLPIFLLLFVFACSEDAKRLSQLEEENAQLKTENEGLKQFSESKKQYDEYIAEVTQTIQEVQDSLETIRSKETSIKIISENVESGKMPPTQREKIISAISEIGSNLRANKDKIAQLQNKLKSYDFKIKGLNTLVENLNKTIIEKEENIAKLQDEIGILNEEIKGLQTKVSEKEVTISEKEKVIADQTKEMNTCYYVIGTQKELEAKKIIGESGGFLGINKKVSVKELERDNFNPIDITQQTEIQIGHEPDKVKILSQQPKTYYELVKNGKKASTIKINNVQKFWESSKYLVILID